MEIRTPLPSGLPHVTAALAEPSAQAGLGDHDGSPQDANARTSLGEKSRTVGEQGRDALTHAGEATGQAGNASGMFAANRTIATAAPDPVAGRGSDASGGGPSVPRAGRSLASGQLGNGAAIDTTGIQAGRYGQAVRDGRGPASIGLDVDGAATYVLALADHAMRAITPVSVHDEAAAFSRSAEDSLPAAREEAQNDADHGPANPMPGSATILPAMGPPVDAASRTLHQALSDELAAVCRTGLGNARSGFAVATAVDALTGAISRAFVDDRAGQVPADLHACLADRLDAARATPDERSLGAGSRAEIYAVNELLGRGAQLENLVVRIEQIGGPFAGEVRPPGPQSAVMLAGVTYAA